jgi:hypothetical protein
MQWRWCCKGAPPITARLHFYTHVWAAGDVTRHGAVFNGSDVDGSSAGISSSSVGRARTSTGGGRAGSNGGIDGSRKSSSKRCRPAGEGAYEYAARQHRPWIQRI